ncbi:MULTISPECIES: response regulator transcription factor [unclassified Pseudomonas]|uniref:response regulator transcription factor n=1 Tax=unclassified Pseudomonas TaxID=196821 RepID=UPI000BA43F63|nr:MULTISPECIES: response regulator transcription factor [unclassified Pseudomonas]
MRSAMIVDDHPFIRSALKVLLEQSNHRVVAQADNGVDAIQLALEHRPQLIILDISIPKLDGLMVLHRLNELGVVSKVLVLSCHPAEFYSMRCMKAGAVGFLSKIQDPDELLKAINVVSSGYTFFPQITHGSVCSKEAESSERTLLKSLSNREMSIFIQLAAGFDNMKIANHLMLSNKTVSTYKARIIEKLGVTSLVHLADMAKRNQLI